MSNRCCNAAIYRVHQPRQRQAHLPEKHGNKMSQSGLKGLEGVKLVVLTTTMYLFIRWDQFTRTGIIKDQFMKSIMEKLKLQEERKGSTEPECRKYLIRSTTTPPYSRALAKTAGHLGNGLVITKHDLSANRK